MRWVIQGSEADGRFVTSPAVQGPYRECLQLNGKSLDCPKRLQSVSDKPDFTAGRGGTEMTFRTLLIIKAVVCLFFGALLLLLPASLLSILGASIDSAGTFTAREYGAALSGTLMLTWFARNTAESDARYAILLDLFVYDAIGFVVTLLAVISGVLNSLGLGVVVVYLFFTLCSGYLLIPKKATA